MRGAIKQEDYFHIVSSLIDAVLFVSRESVIEYANPAAEEIFLKSSGILQGRPLGDLFDDPDVIEEKTQISLKQGTSFRDIESFGRRKIPVEIFPLSVTISPCIAQGSPPPRAILYIRDMGFLKDLENSAQHKETISNLSALSLGMAHEIKNPLVSIGGSAQLLKKRLSDPEHIEFLDVITEEVGRVNRIMNRMLSLANQDSLRLTAINIHEILEKILLLEKSALSDRHQIETRYDPSLPKVTGDSDQLKQVFLNLIRNAIEAMPDGGKLSIITRFHSSYAVKTKPCKQLHQDIVVEIIDTGIGIQDENLKHLFTPFFSTKKRGSGLGLPLSLKIIEKHHGKIKVLSGLKEGTSIQVHLPVAEDTTDV